jgi:hypothetical protein
LLQKRVQPARELRIYEGGRQEGRKEGVSRKEQRTEGRWREMKGGWEEGRKDRTDGTDNTDKRNDGTDGKMDGRMDGRTEGRKDGRMLRKAQGREKNKKSEREGG